MPNQEAAPGDRSGIGRLISQATFLRPTRRQFLLAVGVSAVGAACTKGAPAPVDHSTPPAAGSIGALIAEATQLSVRGTGDEASPMAKGQQRFGFALQDLQNQTLTGGSPQVWLARDQTSRAAGPFTAGWHPFTGYDLTHDRSPRSGAPGDYSVDLDFAGPGYWSVAVVVSNGAQRFAGTGIVPILGSVFADLGSTAISTSTPVATTNAAIAQICSRTPVDQMHYISLDKALANGKPTVAAFTAPQLCESAMCGPVTDEVILLFDQYGADKANFIHIEKWPPGPTGTPPPATEANAAPPYHAWKLEGEPWVFVIDKQGIIRFRSLGPVTAPEIDTVLSTLM